jgi:tetratricopeptide (TPR) repeat protein
MAKKIKPPRDKEAEKAAAAEAKAKEEAAQAEAAASMLPPTEEQLKAEAEAAAAIQDDFQARGFELVDWVQDNQATVMGFLAAVVLAGLGYGVYTVVDKSNNTAATAAFASALEIWETPVSADPPADPPAEGKKKPYATAEEKFKAARTAFEGVTSQHKGRGGAIFSQLYVGHAALELGDPQGAVAAYQAFLDAAAKDDPLRFAGYNGLAAAKEATGDVKGAIAALEDLVSLADKADEDAALLGLGRLYQKDGDLDKARARLEKLIADHAESSLKARADELLASLGPTKPAADKTP